MKFRSRRIGLSPVNARHTFTSDPASVDRSTVQQEPFGKAEPPALEFHPAVPQSGQPHSDVLPPLVFRVIGSTRSLHADTNHSGPSGPAISPSPGDSSNAVLARQIRPSEKMHTGGRPNSQQPRILEVGHPEVVGHTIWTLPGLCQTDFTRSRRLRSFAPVQLCQFRNSRQL